MRLTDDGGLSHLTYCSNIHPGESWMEVFANLEVYVPALKQELAPDDPFGVGLRLSDRAARELLEARHLKGFKAWLDDRDLYVFTMNGFPFGGFHGRAVKDAVYRPDWTSRARVDYTLRLGSVLAHLLPEGLAGGISTSPVSYKPWHREGDLDEVFRSASKHLAEITAHLVELHISRGIFIHVDIEPEPDCLIENTRETLTFFEQWLLPEGGVYLQDRLGATPDEAHALLLDHIRVCYDACHFAVEFEEPAFALAQLTGAGIQIGKVQVSAAVSAAMPAAGSVRDEVKTHLLQFAESTYLHQVVVRTGDGRLERYRDLPDALAEASEDEESEWRIHFHVPVFVDGYGLLSSTRDDLAACLRIVRDQRLTRHLEIETYTWEVLPDAMKQRLSESIRDEYRWTLDAWSKRPPA